MKQRSKIVFNIDHSAKKEEEAKQAELVNGKEIK